MVNDPTVIVCGGSIMSACGDETQTWRHVVEGVTGAKHIVSPVTCFPQINIAAPVDSGNVCFEQEEFLRSVERRYKKRWANASVVSVLVVLNLLDNLTNVQRMALRSHTVGVSFGVAEGGSALREKVFHAVADREKAYSEGLGKRPAIPFVESVEAIPNMPTFHVAQAHGFYGPNLSFSGACASGIQALWGACMLVQSNQADVVITGGSEDLITGTAILPTFHLMGVMTSTPKGVSVQNTPTAFDVSSRGFVLGAGGVAMMVTRKSFADTYALPIVARVKGFGQTNDGFDRAVPDPTGKKLIEAINTALLSSGLGPGDIDVIYTHGAGTLVGDKAEATAIRSVFGEGGSGPFLTAIKPIVGHMMGAASASSIWAAVKSLMTGIVPPIANLAHPIDPDLPFVMGRYIERCVKNVLVLGVGLGGVNAAVVVGTL